MYASSTRLRPLSLAVFGLTSILGLSACDDGSDAADDGDAASLEIVGDYVDDFGGEHAITEDLWVNGDSTYVIAEYDNDAMFVIAQNDPTHPFNPDKWSRFDWTWDGDQLYYCQSVFAGETIDDARNGGADPGDLMTGCGMFPWSMLTPM